MTQSDLFDRRPVFQLRGGMVAATVLDITVNALERLERQLAEKVAQAPQMLQGAPLILGLEKLSDEDGELDLLALLSLCRVQGLSPVAIRASRAEDVASAQRLGIPVLPASRHRERAAGIEEPASAPEASEAVAVSEAVPAPEPSRSISKIITQPVRGGQQIYAPGGDLIVLAPVSAGAEILADGHIHCYGVLRGRALAGVQGDVGAQVFCRQMEAELVSVAGHYRIAEGLRQHALWGKAVRVSFTNDELRLDEL